MGLREGQGKKRQRFTLSVNLFVTGMIRPASISPKKSFVSTAFDQLSPAHGGPEHYGVMV